MAARVKGETAVSPPETAQATADGTATRGHAAELLVAQRFRAAVPSTEGWHIHENVRWVGRTHPHGAARDGEIDLLVAHPQHGILVVEVKSGSIDSDAHGRWYAGGHALDESPFHQAESNKHALQAKLRDLPNWPTEALEPRFGHAVAFPDVELASLLRGHLLLGPDAPTELVFDAAALETPNALEAAVRRTFDYWTGSGVRGRPMSPATLAVLDDFLRPTVHLRLLLRRRIQEGEAELVQASHAQLYVLDTLRGQRRASIVGPAGSGKSLLAVEKTRRLAREGFRTLLVCFNQPLARAFAEELADAHAPGGLVVRTFHGLCEWLGREFGSLGQKPDDPTPEWFAVDLPNALDRAIDAGGFDPFHAIVVDEGQDFEPDWFASLDALLSAQDDPFWVFHDPAQTLLRPDRVATLGLPEFPILENWRNPGPIAELAARFYHGEGPVGTMREDGIEPEIVTAEPGRPTVEAVRRVLHRLTVEEQVRPWQIAVLVGGSMAESLVWREGRFGEVVLWNGNYDVSGRSLGLAAEDVGPEPPDVTVCDSIRRFKGLERDVVVLGELPVSGERLDELMYVGITRAKEHLVVVAPPQLAVLWHQLDSSR